MESLQGHHLEIARRKEERQLEERNLLSTLIYVIRHQVLQFFKKKIKENILRIAEASIDRNQPIW